MVGVIYYLEGDMKFKRYVVLEVEHVPGARTAEDIAMQYNTTVYFHEPGPSVDWFHSTSRSVMFGEDRGTALAEAMYRIILYDVVLAVHEITTLICRDITLDDIYPALKNAYATYAQRETAMCMSEGRVPNIIPFFALMKRISLRFE